MNYADAARQLIAELKAGVRRYQDRSLYGEANDPVWLVLHQSDDTWILCTFPVGASYSSWIAQREMRRGVGERTLARHIGTVVKASVVLLAMSEVGAA